MRISENSIEKNPLKTICMPCVTSSISLSLCWFHVVRLDLRILYGFFFNFISLTWFMDLFVCPCMTACKVYRYTALSQACHVRCFGKRLISFGCGAGLVLYKSVHVGCSMTETQKFPRHINSDDFTMRQLTRYLTRSRRPFWKMCDQRKRIQLHY